MPTCVWNLPMSEPNSIRSLALTSSTTRFQFQRERTAVDETVLVQQRSTVRQQLVALVAGFIPGESRQPQREEKGLSGIETNT